ncbi:EAL domain-containing protein [Phaeobacter sp. QD34_3]|uniref:EAL domain-containing protein n=1 Tax=unclassified Phaeobacter TaxID=2621772 RepID=UPI00237F4A82|nr:MULTISPECIES: EAL domain-containing protein [unclassified Phaeobacter]MDE4134292.1 EAL domain-containing protein [Phaeobacter sp. QD34_3]MDE4138034.1 EAL domain-containing protein [Phaeobacter sp. QD34_24]MDE4174783.1 EAL domain-containing protein [Phaeobacter sp. PT47_59]
MSQNRWKKADLPEGSENPLNAAVVSRDRSTMDMVTEAVLHDQTMLAFQPVMQALPPHQTAFYEGYIRVLDSTGRVIPARDFMHVVEETETGRALDCLALQHGLRALVKSPQIRLSVNMSARSIGYGRWMDVLKRFLKKDATIGERLILEISEASAMATPELVIDFMERMQKHGIAFALDNFGAGTTAIGHFRNFFFDAVKIDGQFIRGVSASSDNQAVTCALVGIAKQFDMLVVAESVESEADAEFLVSIGVDCLQGFLFGAPTVRPPWLEELKERNRA